MKEKILKFKPFGFKAAVILATYLLYKFLFEDFFEVGSIFNRDKAVYYSLAATFLSYVFVLKDKFNEQK